MPMMVPKPDGRQSSHDKNQQGHVLLGVQVRFVLRQTAMIDVFVDRPDDEEQHQPRHEIKRPASKRAENRRPKRLQTLPGELRDAAMLRRKVMLEPKLLANGIVQPQPCKLRVTIPA